MREERNHVGERCQSERERETDAKERVSEGGSERETVGMKKLYSGVFMQWK